MYENAGDAIQVVKAFVVLSEHFKDADRDQLSSELQQHVKTSTAPYKYPRKVCLYHRYMLCCFEYITKIFIYFTHNRFSQIRVFL